MNNKSKSTLICLVKDKNKVLMQLRDNKPYVNGANTWGFPGGGLEPNETLKECAIRELFEETGYKTKDLTPLTNFTAKLDDGTLSYAKAFVTSYDNHQQIQCHEGQKMEFIDIEKGKDLVKTSPLSTYFVCVLSELQNYLKGGES